MTKPLLNKVPLFPFGFYSSRIGNGEDRQDLLFESKSFLSCASNLGALSKTKLHSIFIEFTFETIAFKS